jgi:hypothetical protein
MGLVVVFLLPFFRVVHIRVMRGGGISGSYVEQGVDAISTDDAERELYTWIREHTAQNSIFVDSELDIPVLARRQLYIAMPGRRREDQKGYGRISLIMQVQSGYDHAMLRARRHVADQLLGRTGRLTGEELNDLRSLPGELYVVDRDEAPEACLAQPYFDEVFRSSAGNYTVYILD